MNIYEKINAVMNAIQYLQKDDSVAFASTKYKAISEEKVTSAVRTEMVNQKLVAFPVEMTRSRNNNITSVEVKYRIVNAEAPEEFIEVVSCGDGADTQDKGPGKAMTYAYKYMLLRTFAIPTGEDPDKISSAELDAMEEQRKNEEETVFHFVCERCGEEIGETTGKDGSLIIPAQLVEYSKRRFNGGIYCAKCQKALHDAGEKRNGNS